MSDESPLQPATRAITAGRAASGTSLAPALWASTVWESDGMLDARRRATRTRSAEFYSRYANPTVTSFEEAVASLEGAEASLAFASGMGALATTVLALCSKGDHIVAQRNLYSATLAFLQGPCARFGIETTFVNPRDLGAWRSAIRPNTRLLFAETLGNPGLDVLDVPAVNHYDATATVLDDFFTSKPDYTPYHFEFPSKEIFNPSTAMKKYHRDIDWRKVEKGPEMDDEDDMRRDAREAGKDRKQPAGVPKK